ncbi:hypothetical protein EBE87_23660 [Pseudoroseomonas wenyumeiae]|uniref:Class I SAM-dependent methyltransferase n=1 Tax=Teichococcus wenyumeiae TaxID=2478470 RepID=A0A3A9JCD1_9PROT|nr:hypothetical protein [Pseudoroseomonas wenyumeiae]RKK03131.1 hypothetical protein D6Z83_16090 [Pseudoroseomonas wenyumeiae]RMI17231.1 hypothetical protein EBE87_23660 [Pseudoroseomonas wenyumeiae]
MIDKVHRRKGGCSIVDIGGDREYWEIFCEGYLRSRNVKVVLANIKFSGDSSAEDGIFRYIGADARVLDGFRDKQFDISHSNSLIEHVGSWKDKKSTADETRRIAHSYYVQTPNYWFPIEPHFLVPGFQFLPKQARIALIRKKNRGWIQKAESYSDAAEVVEGCDLLSTTEMKVLFPDATIIPERFLALTKSLIAIGGRLDA